MSKEKEAPKTETKEVAVKEAAGLPSIMGTMMADGAKGAGFETVRPEDCAMPSLAILQSNSKQLLPGKGPKDAKIGAFYNNVTNECVQAPVDVVCCAFKNVMVEWGTRENGGGFIKQHSTEEGEALLKTTKKDDKFRDILPNGGQLQNTNYHFVLALKPNGGYERAVIGFTSTQLKKSKKWLTQMLGMQVALDGGKIFRPPMFGMIYSLGTVAESNAKGNWMGFDISNPRLIDSKEIYAAAKLFNEECNKGLVSVTPPAPADEAEAAGPAVESHNVM